MDKWLLAKTVVSTVIATMCCTIGIIALIRIGKVKKKLESILVFFISLSLGLWSLNGSLFETSWMFGKGVALLIVLSTICFSQVILDNRHKRLMIIILWASALALTSLFFIPWMNIRIYSLIFCFVIYPQVLFNNILIFRYYRKHRTTFHLAAGIMASFMIFFGLYETSRAFFAIPEISAPIIASLAYVVTAWFLIIERGYFNTKTWTDFLIELNQKEKLMQEKLSLMRKANFNSIIILTQTIEAKDPYTRGHCLRVRNYSKAIGYALSFKKEEITLLEFGAVLHDIGKILIPGRILNKNGSLDDEEFAVIKKHTTIGANILKNVESFEPLIPMILHHHESFDGKGYPNGLSDTQIPLGARILAVSDTYDALTSNRPYRSAMSRDKAIEILIKISGSQLDPLLVKTFIEKRIYEISHPESEKVFLDY